ncbi:tRNA (adenine57/58-N1)-methyltransferase [Desulfovibrio sp. DV]|nr:tRNA (adenine57/58-N1)-methyltransferase [Desulfovibrio sp. DV]
MPGRAASQPDAATSAEKRDFAMSFDPACWTRVPVGESAVYLYPQGPDWFVPNAAADAVLGRVAAGQPAGCEEALFLSRLPAARATPYAGRHAALDLGRLGELWLHLTDRCNLACRHCLFCSGPAAALELSGQTAVGRIREAAALGCRVYALTGGEPFCHPELGSIVAAALAVPDSHVVILTNGTGFTDHAALLADWPRHRVHFQVSCDGLAPRHDAMRGPGAFARLGVDLGVAQKLGFGLTLSFCPTTANVGDLPAMVDLAADIGAAGLHFMWHFAAGRGRDDDRPTDDALFAAVTEAAARAEAAGIAIDNLAALASQVFSPAATRHDGATAGWESVAVGPDDRLYPSPALIGEAALATAIDDAAGGLETAWKTSPALDALRRTTSANADSPWRLVLGGGDPDHAWRHSGRFDGADPYLPLRERLAAWMIRREAEAVPNARPDRPGLRLKMGETHESCHAHGEVALAHTNCLLSIAGQSSLGHIKDFYTEAAAVEKGDIVNPVRYPLEMVEHIPEFYRVRGYGCGSPIADAGLVAGETVVDLGCGAGVECLIAARQVGPHGRAIGIDMLPAMLSRATRAAAATAEVLGYANAVFFQGYLEALPLAEATADCITSNCVLNLSTRKRRLYAEIFRILKPGGRIVFSDVATETPAAAAICNDPTLRGECISGTLTQRDLFAILEESGFTAVRIIRRFPYRVVGGHDFYSVTVEARKPLGLPPRRKVLYRGPFRAVVTASGDVLRAGEVRTIVLYEEDLAGHALLVLDQRGNIANPDFTAGGTSCCCGPAAGQEVAELLQKLPNHEALTPLNLSPSMP